MNKLRLLNLYANIGGNRKLWGDEYEVTAVEIVPELAEAYKDLYPNDTVIIGDAHKYLLENFKEFDFIWSSPPCPTHSRLRTGLKEIVYPEMSLYQEIILLQNWFDGKWIVENVIPYYDTLIKPNFEIDRHFIWCNFHIPNKDFNTNWVTGKVKDEKNLLEQRFGFNLSKYSGFDKRKALRNCVVPEMGLHILNAAFKNVRQITPSVSKPLLFDFA